MGDDGMSREQCLDELRALRQRVSHLEGAVESLRRGEAMHLAMMDAIDDGIHINDADGRYVAVNAEMASRHEMIKEDLIGSTPFDLYDSETAQIAMGHYRHVFETGEAMDAEMAFPGKKASHRHIHRTPLRNEAGQIAGVVTVSRDITARKQAEEELKRERDFTSAVIDTIGSLVVVLDRQARIIRLNRAFERVTGYTLEEVKGKPFWKVFPSTEIAQGKSAFDRTLSGQFPNSDENCLISRDGSQRLIAWTNTALLDSAGAVEHVISAGTDITEQRQAEVVLRDQAIRDPLTGLFNRRYMEEMLERELLRASRRESPVGILMMDIDHFKQFNDLFGHEAGDTLLALLGNFLRARVRGEDIVCRYGGDEISLILPDSSLDDTVARAGELLEGIRSLRVEHRRRPLGPITVSIGVAVFPEKGANVDDVLRASDLALYQAKAEGRDRVIAAR